MENTNGDNLGNDFKFNVAKPMKVKGNPKSKKTQEREKASKERKQCNRNLVDRFGKGIVAPKLSELSQLLRRMLKIELLEEYETVTVKSVAASTKVAIEEQPLEPEDIDFVLDSDTTTKALKKIEAFCNPNSAKVKNSKSMKDWLQSERDRHTSQGRGKWLDPQDKRDPRGMDGWVEHKSNLIRVFIRGGNV